MDKSGRRPSARQAIEATIQIVLASNDSEKDRNSNALIPIKICNQSDTILNIEMDRAIRPGSNVRVSMVVQKGNDFEKVQYIRDGRVVRCEKIGDASSRYRIGIKILRKVIQAQVLSNRFKPTRINSMRPA